MAKKLTTHEAFQHFIDGDPYKNFKGSDRGKMGANINRFKSGKLSNDKMTEILLAHRYRIDKRMESKWMVPGKENTESSTINFLKTIDAGGEDYFLMFQKPKVVYATEKEFFDIAFKHVDFVLEPSDIDKVDHLILDIKQQTYIIIKQ